MRENVKQEKTFDVCGKMTELPGVPVPVLHSQYTGCLGLMAAFIWDLSRAHPRTLWAPTQGAAHWGSV